MGEGGGDSPFSASRLGVRWPSSRLPLLAMLVGQDWNGAVAQLGERVVRNDEVSGSIPLGSTSRTYLYFAHCHPLSGW
jgi:hypothetical protein